MRISDWSSDVCSSDLFAPSAVQARVLNKLLQREDWARDRLSRHSGKTVRFALGGFKTGFTLRAGGLVDACDPAIVPDVVLTIPADNLRSEEHTSELQSLMRLAYAVFCLKKKKYT